MYREMYLSSNIFKSLEVGVIFQKKKKTYNIQDEEEKMLKYQNNI